MLLLALASSLFIQVTAPASQSPLPPSSLPSPSRLRAIAIDEAFASRANLKLGDTVSISSRPGSGRDLRDSEHAIVGAIVRRGADPSEVARGDLRVRMHLDQLQRVSGYGDRVDRFAIATAPSTSVSAIIERINHVAFGFRAYPSREIAVETSRTFQVVSRFHRAIGVITIVASSVFLLCIMVLKVEERRRDIAALRLMGISRASVVRSIVIESALVAVLGCVLGVALGWAASLVVNWHYQALYRTPLQFSIVTAPIVAFAVGLSLLLGIGAGLLASLRLVRTPPLQLFGR
ncbi:MAG TPA: FtsX-like permease family protein [Gemmatimonadaceae bacterium]|nr:FtsX-like permease family protein [Gemmatimonadaceae bacterium]